jgi:large subunit ribosomal protein L52
LGRLQKQRQYASQIVDMIGEVDYAVERHNRLQQAKVDEKQKLLSTKLIPKGHLMLKKK